MIVSIVLIFVTAIRAVPDQVPLERLKREDAIYVLRGSRHKLSQFHNEAGRKWVGGTAIDDDPDDGTLKYWAYSDRTAAQSRSLLMPAIFSGLNLSINEYREAEWFPVERKQLDELATRCGAKIDPFFLTPKRTVQLIPTSLPARQTKCLSTGVASKLRMKFNEKRK